MGLLKSSLSVVAVASFLVTSCNFSHIRDVRVYQTEISLISKIIEDQSMTLKHFLASHCECEEEQWVTFRCAQAAETLSVVESRWGWHRQMMLFNADLSDSPGPIPDIEEVRCEKSQP